MTGFNSSDAYSKFVRSVLGERRYIHTQETQDFIQAVLDAAVELEEQWQEGLPFWRARIGFGGFRPYEQDDVIDECPFPFELADMLPQADRARENRANPKGIPVVYGASHFETAVAEIRPNYGAQISVGLFRVKRAIRLVNFTHAEPILFNPFKDLPPPDYKKIALAKINAAYSTPVEPTDDVASYAPTQILAEAIKVYGYDGIAYKSAQGGPGHNIALFDPLKCELMQCQLRRVEVKYDAKNDNSPYSVTIYRELDPPDTLPEGKRIFVPTGD